MNRFRTDDGAAAVEMGLLLPLLIMLAFGIIEFSTAYNRSQGMEAAVREGARFAATGDAQGSQIIDRVHLALQGDEGGSGFPAAGGSGSISGDVVVEISDDVAGEIGADDRACDPAGTATQVTVSAYIRDAYREGAYGLSLPLIPNSPFPLDLYSEAVFPCL